MKKYLFIIMGVLSFFFFSDSVNALTFEDGTIVDDTNFIYYVYAYHSEDFENYQYFSAFKNVTGPYRAIVFFNDSKKPYFPNNPGNLQLYTGLRVCSFYLDKDNYSCKDLTEDNMRTSYTLLFTNYSYNSSIQANITKDDLSNFETTTPTYKITYYINNELYQEFEVEKGSSHSLLNYIPLEHYTFSGWSYDSNIDLSNINSDVNIYGTTEYIEIKKYTIFYYLNNELYKEVEVEEGSSHSLVSFSPPENYTFSGWSYDSNFDLSNITSDIIIYGTTQYINPDIGNDEDDKVDIDSVIHSISVSIIGDDIPVEFDYLYTIMDFILLIILVLVVLSPFIIFIKLFNGRW